MPNRILPVVGDMATNNGLGGGSVLFIGNATTLIRCGAFTLLTDPNFLHAGARVPLGYGMHTTRRTDPALEIDDLPPLDACILSHMHGDHWDSVAEERLPRNLPVITTPSAARTLRARGFGKAQGLRTWRRQVLRRGDETLSITAVPAKHGPGFVNALLPETMGSILEWQGSAGRGFRIYISGDTLVHPRLREIAERYPEIDLGLIHLGGTRVLGLLVTMDAKQGVEAIRIVNPNHAIPIHFDDYEAFTSPLSDFKTAVSAAGIDDAISYLERGEEWTFGDITSSMAANNNPVRNL